MQKSKLYQNNLAEKVQEVIDDIHKNIPPDYYDQGIKKNLAQAYWHKKRFKAIKDLLQDRHWEDILDILDIGCHAGTLTRWLYHLNHP
jgi:2-polyprenyl-3-methyl-5-hydroxy-6-metoxy-1,4-benzoquinol methylase